MNSLDNLDEVNTLFKNIGASQEAATKVLKGTHFADTFNDTVEGAAEGAEAMSNLAKATDGLKDGASAVDDLGNAFKGLGVQIGRIAPLALGLFSIGVALYGVHKYLNRFNDAVDKSAKSFSAYKEASSELENLKNQSFPLPEWIRDFPPLEPCAASRTPKKDYHTK